MSWRGAGRSASSPLPSHPPPPMQISGAYPDLPLQIFSRLLPVFYRFITGYLTGAKNAPSDFGADLVLLCWVKAQPTFFLLLKNKTKQNIAFPSLLGINPESLPAPLCPAQDASFCPSEVGAARILCALVPREFFFFK